MLLSLAVICVSGMCQAKGSSPKDLSLLPTSACDDSKEGAAICGMTSRGRWLREDLIGDFPKVA
jgi:hypothetical protein